MAKRKKSINKKIEKEIKKSANKHPVATLLVVVALVIVLGGGAFLLYKLGYIDFGIKDSEQSSTSQHISNNPNSSSYSEQPIEGDLDALDFYLISLNTSKTLYNGDSIYIKAGSTDILIDAGSKAWNYSTISAEINKHCTDGKLEYVVATHADADHIPGFYGTKENGIFYNYDVETIIDFPLSNKDISGKSTTTYDNYKIARDYAVSKGAKHYTALECWNNQNGAQRLYNLGQGITMEVLYQRYYEEAFTGNENNYSVSLLFKQGNKKMLLAGDLEEEGTESLLEKNSIGEVDLFKGGHHGSINANPDSLLSVIKPKTICTCCVAGSNEYTSNNANTMPYQATIDNWAKYTDDVYLTNYAESTGKASSIGAGGDLNGTINVHYDQKGNKTVTGSNNSLKLKETDWMKNNRTMPASWQ